MSGLRSREAPGQSGAEKEKTQRNPKEAKTTAVETAVKAIELLIWHDLRKLAGY